VKFGKWTWPHTAPHLTGHRFKKLADAKHALETGDYSKAEKVGKKGWRNAKYELVLIHQ